MQPQNKPHLVNNYQPKSVMYSSVITTPIAQQQLPPQQRPPFQPIPPPQPKTTIMYKSTIQPIQNSHPNPLGGLGKLETMGRLIKEDVAQPRVAADRPQVFSNQNQQPLTFRVEKSSRPKMASSAIFFNKPTENVHNKPSTLETPKRQENASNFSGLQGLEGLMSKARSVKEQQVVGDEKDQLVRNFSQTDRPSNNRQMFKSSIEGQVKPKGTFAELNFQNPQNSNAPKKFQFFRNPNASKISQQSKKEEKVVSAKLATPVQSTSVVTTPAKESSQQTGMFKKKTPFVDNSSGKTDENLLKALGINLSKSPKAALPSPQTFDNIILDQPKAIVPSNRINEPSVTPLQLTTPQKSETKTEIRKFSKSDFWIGKKMGKGQFGEVNLVRHKLTGFICGMKTMQKKEIKSQKYENQIARQLSIQFYLAHRYITPLYGYFEDKENVYLLVEFCTDGQLLEKLRKNRRMEQEDVSPIIRQICEGLDYVHKEEIIHRDGTVKIGDFGWAVHCGNGMRKTVSGSPLYYSPEIVMETQYDQKIDIWAIGMMTYECLLGKIPFRIYSELDLNRIVSDDVQFPDYVDVTDEAKDFILKIMKKKPEQRLEMREILRHPFITKYARDKKVAGSVLEEFRKVVNA